MIFLPGSVGVELYFEDLERAKEFYLDTLGPRISDEQPVTRPSSVLMPRLSAWKQKGPSPIPPAIRPCFSFEVPDPPAAVTAIGQHCSARSQPRWAVLHDPEGHNILLLPAGPK